MNKTNIEEIQKETQVPNNTDIIIEIKNGEINVMISGPPKKFLIINDDEKTIILKNVRDPFMNIPSVVKSKLEKWEKIKQNC